MHIINAGNARRRFPEIGYSALVLIAPLILLAGFFHFLSSFTILIAHYFPSHYHAAHSLPLLEYLLLMIDDMTALSLMHQPFHFFLPLLQSRLHTSGAAENVKRSFQPLIQTKPNQEGARAACSAQARAARKLAKARRGGAAREPAAAAAGARGAQHARAAGARARGGSGSSAQRAAAGGRARRRRGGEMRRHS